MSPLTVYKNLREPKPIGKLYASPLESSDERHRSVSDSFHWYTVHSHKMPGAPGPYCNGLTSSRRRGNSYQRHILLLKVYYGPLYESYQQNFRSGPFYRGIKLSAALQKCLTPFLHLFTVDENKSSKQSILRKFSKYILVPNCGRHDGNTQIHKRVCQI